jgi:hypothetical protein
LKNLALKIGKGFAWVSALLSFALLFQNCSPFQAAEVIVAAPQSSTQPKAGPSVALTWSTDPLSTQDSFSIEQSTDGVSYAFAKKVDGALSTASIGGLLNGKKYYFRIKAQNAAGDSLSSQIVTADIPATN